MYYFLLFFWLINFCFGLELPNWMIKEISEKYKVYHECLLKRENDYKQYQNSRRFYGIFAPENSLVTLNCFDWFVLKINYNIII